MANGTLIYGILIILVSLICTFQMTNSTEKDQICDNLWPNNSKQLNILAVGKTKKRLLLITKDLLVYDVAVNSLDRANKKLHLGSKPMAMADKYPILYSSSVFQYIKNEPLIAFTMIDEDSEWICLVTTNTNPTAGVNYDIDHSQTKPGWQYTGNISLVMISTDHPCQFYSLNARQGLQINRWHCEEGKRVRDRPGITPKYHHSAICYDQTQTNIILERIAENGTCSSGTPVTWPVLKGFVSEGRFYLFGQSHIYVFDENVYSEPARPYPFEEHSYDSFFNCPGIIPPNAVMSDSEFYGMIATIIVLLAIVLIITWCISRICDRRKQRSLIDEKNEMNSKLNLSKLSTNVSTPKSMASKMISAPVRNGSLSLSGRSEMATVDTSVDSNKSSKIPLTSNTPNQLSKPSESSRRRSISLSK